MKPRVFIGSSVEGLDVAYAVQENLDYTAEVTVWDQGIFKLSSNTLDDLINSLDKFDFSIFVFRDDDISQIRKQEYQSVRDNVLFELGLFIGRLGKRRCFILMPRGISDFRLPTDLLGVTPANYNNNRQDNNLKAALGPSCHKIQQAMSELGTLEHHLNIAKIEKQNNQNTKLQFKKDDVNIGLKLRIIKTIAKYFDRNMANNDKTRFIYTLKPPYIHENDYSNIQTVVELDYYLEQLIEEGFLEQTWFSFCITKNCRNYLVENKLI